MKNQLNKILKVTFIILFFSLSKSYSIDDVTEFTDAINEAREEFNNISEGTTEKSKIIDEAIKEIDKATEYVQEAINNNNAEDAIRTLEFIEKSLTDVSSIIPQEFTSDMSKIDVAAIPKENMDIVNEITAQMKTAKEQNLKDFMSELVDLNQKGIDTISISKNLNSLGIDTINLVLDLGENKRTETWTKEEWANAYTGSVLTSVGSEVVTDKEINNKVIDLEQELKANAVAILDKRSSLTELQTKIDPLSNQIIDLKAQKSDLLTKYNEQIVKQSSAFLSDEEINKSKELADQFNQQLSGLTNQIKSAEQQSNSLQQQIQGLNLELNNEIVNKTQIQNNIRDLNSQLSLNQNLLSAKTVELTQVKNTNLNDKIANLNNQLESVTLQRDFAQKDLDKSLDKEVEAFQYYYSALGNVNADNYDIQAEYAVREVQAILNPDPKEYRSFELEKYSKLAGLPQNIINEGLTAIANDDWDKQKSVYRQVYNALEKNPQAVLPDGWEFGNMTDGDINVMIAEERAMQEAVYASIELSEIKNKVDVSISDKTKNLQALINLNPTTLQYAATYEGMKEHEPLMNEINKILENNQDIALKQNQITDLQNQIDDFNLNKDKYYEAYQNQIAQANLDFQKLEQEISQHSALNGWGNKEWVDKYNALREQRVEIFYDRFAKFEDPTFKNISEINNLNYQISTIERSATSEARSNLINAVQDAQKQYEQIVAEESKALTEYQNKISSILKEIPTFEKDANLVVNLNPVQLRAKLVDIASNGNFNESAAVEKALKELSELGEDPVSQFMTGPMWEASNVKTAAIVRSTKYSYVDDYAYITATYADPLALDAADRAELKGEIQVVLGAGNVVLDSLNSKVENLSAELNLTKQQSQNITSEISKLESELSSLKNSEKDIQTQINNLTNQFNSKENLITEKTKSLTSLQDQLNPLSGKMNELQGQRAELDTKLNEQLNTIANQIQNNGQATDEANALKAQFESQIAQLDNQLKDYENQSVELNNQLNSLTTELSVLESEAPEIVSQIDGLNKDLDNFENLKADLAMSIAKDIGLKVDEKAIKSIEVIDGKVVIALKGQSLVSVVDEKMLIDKAVDFIDPISKITVNSNIYNVRALNPAFITPEFIEAAKSISVKDAKEVVAQATALNIAGATTQQTTIYAEAKAARLSARQEWDAAMASGDKARAAAAEAAFMSAKTAEQQAGLAVAAATAAASSAAQSASAAQEAAQEVAQEVGSVAQEVASVEGVQDATKAAQQAALDALWELEKLPGSTGMHTLEVTAAIRQAQAELNGNDFNYLGASSYEEAMQVIKEAEAAGKSQIELENELGNHDVNRMGPCGQASC